MRVELPPPATPRPHRLPAGLGPSLVLALLAGSAAHAQTAPAAATFAPTAAGQLVPATPGVGTDPLAGDQDPTADVVAAEIASPNGVTPAAIAPVAPAASAAPAMPKAPDPLADDRDAAPAASALALPAPETADPRVGDHDPADPAGADPGVADPAVGAPPATSADAPTQAERDYAAIYGNGAQEYDPVADPTLPAPAHIGAVYDPWQRYNRRMHRFNNVVDRRIARPLARAYVRVVPRPLRLGIGNFFSNLGQPVAAVNSLLQGKPKQAAQAAGRFVLNSTLGIGGIFDPAGDARLPNKSEDFGQTLGVWGWQRSRYVELPLFGPRTVRDVFGMVGDAPLSPLRQVEADRLRVPLQGLQLVDVRAQLLATDSLREGATDDYALVRDAWSQRRNYQIFGDQPGQDAQDGLPEYLFDETDPIIPAGAMPVMPTDGS